MTDTTDDRNDDRTHHRYRVRTVVGIGPAIAAGALGAVFSARGSRLPLPASVALGVALAALNGYFVGVLEPGLVRTQLPASQPGRSSLPS